MSRHDAAPTHTWVITSLINRWIVRLCLFLTAIILVAGWTVVAKLQADCTDATFWQLNLGSYNVALRVSKDFKTCEKTY